MNVEEFKEKNKHHPRYAHFDAKIGLEKKWNYITNPKKVAFHGFYPFISYVQSIYKYSEEGGIKVKERPICYSAHVDRCIYQYYGYLLNEEYNMYSERKGFSKSVAAYRTNLHKNNIHFAKEAFDFIKQDECEIIVGDFTSFFDNLDHSYLKKTLNQVLGTQRLSEDWFNVYKNITKYSTWNLLDILKIRGLLHSADLDKIKMSNEKAKQGDSREARKMKNFLDKKIKELNNSDLALTKDEFKYYKKMYNTPNKKTFGIPQGSSISAVLSNVYMVNFDEKICKYVKKINGLYLRYSDDFIIVIPKSNNFDEVQKLIHTVVDETQGLVLQPDKTKFYHYKNRTIKDCTDSKNIFDSYIDYLGFVFDGKEVTLRQKTISKYYYRMYRKLNFAIAAGGFTKNDNRISYKNLYMTYSQKGRNGEYGVNYDFDPYKAGNFFTYVFKAQKIFEGEPIMRHTNRHMLKIRRKRQLIESKIK